MRCSFMNPPLDGCAAKAQSALAREAIHSIFACEDLATVTEIRVPYDNDDVSFGKPIENLDLVSRRDTRLDHTTHDLAVLDDVNRTLVIFVDKRRRWQHECTR